MANTENYLEESISYAKAVISCFALYFPEEVKEEAFVLSTNSNNDIIQHKKDFINKLDTDGHNDTIRSLASTYLNTDNSPLNDLRLVLIFDLLFSKVKKPAVRASLISTFRVMIKDYKNNTCFKDYLRKSYQLYCEAYTPPSKINWFSENSIGAYSLMDPTEESDSGPSSDDEKAYGVDSNGKVIKIPYNWTGSYGFIDIEQRKAFLGEIYDLLQRNSEYNLLKPPEKGSDKDKWEKLKSGKYALQTCSKENFINMFAGVTEDKPIKTIICGKNTHLSAFIDVLDNPVSDHEESDALDNPDSDPKESETEAKKRNRSTNRSNIRDAIQKLILSTNGDEIPENTLQKQVNRYGDAREKYKEIIRNAHNEIKRNNNTQ